MYLKVRVDHRVQSRGLLIAVGVNEEGHREIIGFQLTTTESKNSWSDFFQSLKERGLKNAIEKEFQGATWQRCHECPVGKRIFPAICWIKRRKCCNQP